jgi:ABC-type branched-subunit amino acid transport system substrate-binding protein
VDEARLKVFELDGTLSKDLAIAHTAITTLQPSLQPLSSRFLYVQDITVSTLAGDGQRDYRDGPAAQARFNWPGGVAADAQGNVYVAEFFGHRVRRITADGTVSTLAGTGAPGHADGPGSTAQFNMPAGLDVDAEGNIYVADAGNDCMRLVRPDGTVITLAGDGNQGYQDGPAAQTQFYSPTGVAVDASGVVYVADLGNNRLRAIGADGQVTTLAGSGAWGFQDGAPDQAQFYGPYRLTVDGAGNLYVVDGLWILRSGNHAIRRVAPDGMVSTVAGSAGPGFADGTADASQAGAEAGFLWPGDVAVDAAGNLYVADSANHRIRVITPRDTVYTLAGTGAMGYVDGAGTEAALFWPEGVAWDGAGRLYVTESYGNRVRVVHLPESLAASPPLPPPDPHTGQNVIKIGFVDEHPAPANIVAAARMGAQLAVDEANAAGGVLVGDTRYTLALVTAHDWYLPPDADWQAAARRLLEQGVVAVVGHVASETSMGAAKVYGPAGVVMVSPISSDPDLTQAGWWTVYRVTSHDAFLAPVAARMTYEELGLRRAVLLGEASPHVQTVVDSWHRAFEALGGQVVGRVEADVEPPGEVTTQLRAWAPEVVVLFPARALPPSQLARRVLEADVDALIVGVESFSDLPFFLSRVGDGAEGAYDAVTGPPRAAMPGYADFATRYREAGLPIMPDPDDFMAKWAPFGYDAAGVIIAAVRQAADEGEVTRQSVALAMETFRHQPYPGVTGAIRFDKYGDLWDQSASFKKVVNGQWVDVIPSE